MTNSRHVDVLIIGAGISGIGVAAHLIKETTGKSFAILERRQAMGGTWDVFRYPGIRSDSDMYTFGYGFHPWHGTKVLSDGAKIKQYVEETADHFGVAEHINFGKRVSTASRDSGQNRWTLAVVDEASGTSEEWTSRYLVAATGIFDQDTAYRPDFPGEEDFKGPIIHPQFWPQDYDYVGKKVVIIGSGATAVTLAPSMAPTAEHVTVLQRSPTYLVALPSEDPVTLAMRKARVPGAVIAKAARARWIAVNRGFFQLSKSRPEIAKRFLLGQARAHLGSKVDMVHFTPTYEPWDQRLCVVPNGDLFKAIRRGEASIVTDRIKRFDETGILLESGEHLDADVIVAATGMNLRILGGVTVVVDGQRVELSERVLYKQALIEGVPNAVTIIGYTNISWTLKTDLISEYFVRLLKHMDRNGHERFEANASDAPAGLDLEKLSLWLAAAIPGAGADLSATVLAGGKSNLTYAVTDGVATWVVRRPPLGHVLATAHDMAREYRVMAALQDTDVPAPATVAFCDDGDVLGAPFYVMEYVDGYPYRYAAELEPLGPERTRRISEGLVDTLSALHAVDPLAIGLGDFGRPEGFLGRQVRLWKKQMDASYTRDLPAADELHRLLSADIPVESATGIVHGDFRLDNILTDAQDRPAAVIDWEMATLGDPLTDLALMCVYGRLGDQMQGDEIVDSASAPGFLSEDEIIARYAANSDRDLSRFGFYLGLASYKLAAILEGIHYRHLQGQTVGEGFAGIGEIIPPLLDAGLVAMKENH